MFFFFFSAGGASGALPLLNVTDAKVKEAKGAAPPTPETDLRPRTNSFLQLDVDWPVVNVQVLEADDNVLACRAWVNFFLLFSFKPPLVCVPREN